MLNIHLFSHLRASADGTLRRFAARRKTPALLAYLLLHRNNPVRRETVAFTLWPDDSEADARSNLRRHLHHLQQVLPGALPDRPWLLSNVETIQWNPVADYWLDVAEFEQLSASPDNLANAIALYTGDLLEDVYDDWLFYERERLRTLYFSDLSNLILQSRSRGDYLEAIACAEQTLARDPLREATLRQLMTLRYEAGDRAGALQEYERFTRRLRQELVVEPMPESLALYQAIVYNERLTVIASPSAIETPTFISLQPRHVKLPFVGREAEMEQLRALWSRAARGHGGSVLIGGEAGIGKTRLATELAFVAESQGARVLTGGTTVTEPMPYQAVVGALRPALPMVAELEMPPVWLAAAAALLPELRTHRPNLPSAPPLDPDRERARLFEALARCLEGLTQPRPVLIILEDLHWAGAATVAFLEFMARRIPQHPLLVLVTYREEETSRAHPLRDLCRNLRRENLATHLALSRLSASAVEVLVAQIHELDSRAADYAQHLSVESEGNPFFLGELIRDGLESRGDTGQTEPERAALLREALTGQMPDNVRSTIVGRLARLTPQAQSLAELAAVIGPAFDVELTREVGGWSEGELLGWLDELLDHQLIHEVGGHSRYDYTFAHHLIQATIYAEIDASTLARRHRRIGLVLEQLHQTRLDDLAGELALHFDRGNEQGRAAGYYLRVAHHALAVYANEEALTAASRGLELVDDRDTQFALLELHEETSRRMGERELQHADLEAMDALARAIGDDDRIGEVLRRQITLQRRLGERKAEAQLIAALKAHAVATGARRWQAEALQAEAAQAVLLGQYETAHATLEQALTHWRALENLPGQVACICLLAEVAVHRGQLDEVNRMLDQANVFSASLTDRSLIAKTLLVAASAALVQQDYGTSARLGQQMLDLCGAIGDREGEADAHVRIAIAATRLFRIAEALDHYAQARTIYAAIGKRAGEAAVLLNAGTLAARLGSYAAALGDFQQAGVLFKTLNDPRGQAASALNVAYTALQQGDYQVSKEAARRGLDLARTMQNRAFEASALANLGAAERELGELVQAIAHMEAGLALRRELEQPADLAIDLCDLALAYLGVGNLDAARRSTDELMTLHISESTSDPQRILWTVAYAHHVLGDATRASELLDQAHIALQRQAAAIPELALQTTFLQLPFNRELLAAYERGHWPRRPDLPAQ